MTRNVPEWVGKTDESAIPQRVKLRILERQGNKCPVTSMLFGPACRPEFDHITALVNGGENRESNIQALSSFAHKEKTAKDVAQKKKDRRVRAKHMGLKPKAYNPIPGSKGSRWKKKPCGTVIDRETGLPV
ncbi:hypothetical protein [Halocynthiibacter styelae]|uniref:HNH endonuclease n=1 Tax=Halocynthiibacter styelae TaxID=2761955 RepID=A0A8J7ID10_9RHOB|nr:hypothetical protein [Paenihalocynthiibacter styelae]MBI1493439.1 HNH endonuclease [Paenihalocynthiibacter styelae]